MRKNLTTIFSGIPAAVLLAALGSGAAWGQTFSLEGAVIDSRNGNSLGVVTERGDLAALFRAQKAMTFGILRSAGISLEQLSPEVRARIERFQTTNVEAFRAFSQGLDLKDQGKFGEAREFFKRAAELDPNFTLAAEQQQSMPDVNLGGNLQVRAVMVAAAGAAVDRGKATFVVDVARAVAAIQAGQSVVTVAAPPTEQTTPINEFTYSSNAAGSSNQFGANLVAGLSYSFATAAGGTLSLASPNEWRPDEYRVNTGVLESAGGPRSGFLAQRLGASSANNASATLVDGSVAYWGSWLSAPGASASVTVSGQPVTAPALGRVDYVIADATRVMPGTGTALYTPRGGFLGAVTGNISVDFVTRSLALQNLGFQIGSLSFSGLTGTATYDARVASGAFSGNYTGGSCTGCAAFTPLSSSYAGNFVGSNASGLVFSTFLLTGNGGTAAGVHLFGR